MTSLDAFRLDGRTALVTGAGRGLGSAASVALAEAGAHVVVAGRRLDALEGTVKRVEQVGGTCEALVLDVADSDQVQSVFDSVSARRPIHVLINNAGVDHEESAVALRVADWQRVLEVNLGGTFYCASAFARAFTGTGGSIVNLGSIGAAVGVRGQSAYSASKGGVVALTRALALEFAPLGIRVNALSPGYFATDMPAQVLADPSLAQRLLRKIPLRYVPEPEEIGPPIIFLASQASAYMTGASLSFDGGYTAR